MMESYNNQDTTMGSSVLRRREKTSDSERTTKSTKSVNSISNEPPDDGSIQSRPPYNGGFLHNNKKSYKEEDIKETTRYKQSCNINENNKKDKNLQNCRCSVEQSSPCNKHQDNPFNQSQCNNSCNQSAPTNSSSQSSHIKTYNSIEDTSTTTRRQDICYSRKDSSWLKNLNCCRKSPKKSVRNNIKNNFDDIFYDEYRKLPSSPATSCTGTMSINTASSCLTSLLSQTSMSNFSQDLSISLSLDSGFDESPCLLNMIYDDHTCTKSTEACLKKHYTLNMHLKNLMSNMPKPFSDSEAIRHELSNSSGVKRNPYLSRRRNAICETSSDTKLKFCEALSAFLTLKAMAKYDFL